LLGAQSFNSISTHQGSCMPLNQQRRPPTSNSPAEPLLSKAYGQDVLCPGSKTPGRLPTELTPHAIVKEDTVQFPEVINATPHPLPVYDTDGEEIVVELPTSGLVITAGERLVTLSDAIVFGARIPVHGSAYGSPAAIDRRGNPIDVPEPRDGVFYVVALAAALSAPTRTDFLVCGPAVRDEHGRMIGSRGLTVPHHPVAAHPFPRALLTRDVGELVQQHTGETYPWADMSTASVFRDALEHGLISQEERDLAREQYPGQNWFNAGI
jgi:hypothetical protein